MLKYVATPYDKCASNKTHLYIFTELFNILQTFYCLKYKKYNI